MIAKKKNYDYLIFMILSLGASATNFISNVIFGRMLSVEDYGGANSVLAFLTNIVFVVTPIQVMLCTFVASNRSSIKILHAIKTGIFLSMIEMTVLLFFMSSIVKYLQISNVSFVLLVLYLPAYLFFYLTLSLIQGKKKYILYGLMMLLLMIVKLLTSVIAIKYGCRHESILVGYFVAYIVCGLIGLFFVDEKVFISEDRGLRSICDKEILKYYGWSFVLISLVNLYNNGGEIILMTGRVDSTELGMYSVAISISKVGFYLVSMIGTILLPEVASEGDIQVKKKIVCKTLGVTSVVVGLFSVIVLLLGQWIIVRLYGEKYAESSRYFPVALIYVGVTAMFYIIYQYSLAEERFTVLAILVMAFSGLFFGVCQCLALCDVKMIPIGMAVSLFVPGIVFLFVSFSKKSYKNNESTI